jgi:hypothetical protein
MEHATSDINYPITFYSGGFMDKRYHMTDRKYPKSTQFAK